MVDEDESQVAKGVKTHIINHMLVRALSQLYFGKRLFELSWNLGSSRTYLEQTFPKREVGSPSDVS